MSENVPAVIQEELHPATEGSEVWERLFGESRTAYKNFVEYRNQTRGRRSLKRAADDLGKHVETLKQQSAKYRWQRRVDLYDDHLERRDRELLESERDELNRQGARSGRALLGLGTARAVGGRFGGREIQPADTNDVGLGEAARIMEIGWRMTRLATGQPTDAIKGLVALTPQDHLQIVGDLLDITLYVMPEELHARFSAMWNSYLDTGLRPF